MKKVWRYILLWFLSFLKSIFYSPVVVGFAVILIIMIIFIQDSISPSVSSRILRLLFPEDGIYDAKDILSIYNLCVFFTSFILAFIGVLIGKRITIRRKKIFFILVSASAVGWLGATALIYSQSGGVTNFLWIGTFLFAVHLFFITIGLSFSHFVDIMFPIKDESL